MLKHGMGSWPVEEDEAEHVLFFTAGNPEVHRILRAMGRTNPELIRDVGLALRISCFLGDLVLQSSSNFYESDITKEVTHRNIELFRRRIAVYVLRRELGDFDTELEKSQAEYPRKPEYQGYFGDEGKVRARSLKELGYVYRREGKMAAAIDMLWQKGLSHAITDEAVCGKIESDGSISVQNREALTTALLQVPDRREGRAFIWDLVEAEAFQPGIAVPRNLQAEVRRYLLRTYLRAAQSLFPGATVLNNPSIYLGDILPEAGSVSKYNVQLFLSLCETAGIRRIIERISAADIVRIRDRLEFCPFRKAYFSLVDSARSIEDAKIKLVDAWELEKGIAFSRTQIRGAIRKASRDGLIASANEQQPAGAMTGGDVLTNQEGFSRILEDYENIAFVRMRGIILEMYEGKMERLLRRLRERPSREILIGGKIEVKREEKNYYGDSYSTTIHRADVVQDFQNKYISGTDRTEKEINENLLNLLELSLSTDELVANDKDEIRSIIEELAERAKRKNVEASGFTAALARVGGILCRATKVAAPALQIISSLLAIITRLQS